jgi:hypothetical protein
MKQLQSPKARQVLAITSNARCDKTPQGSSFTDPAHRKLVEAFAAAGLLEITSRGKFAGLKEVCARLTDTGLAAYQGMLGPNATACRACGVVH